MAGACCKTDQLGSAPRALALLQPSSLSSVVVSSSAIDSYNPYVPRAQGGAHDEEPLSPAPTEIVDEHWQEQWWSEQVGEFGDPNADLAADPSGTATGLAHMQNMAKNKD